MNNVVLELDQERSLEMRVQSIPEVSACILVHLTGHLDACNSVFFTAQMEKILASGSTRIIFNCSGLAYISSLGIGSLVRLQKEVSSAHGCMVFVGMPRKLLELFELLGLKLSFDFFSSVKEAVTGLTRKGLTYDR